MRSLRSGSGLTGRTTGVTGWVTCRTPTSRRSTRARRLTLLRWQPRGVEGPCQGLAAIVREIFIIGAESESVLMR